MIANTSWMKLLLVALIFLTGNIALEAQTLTGISSRWADDFSEWDIFTDDEDVVGELVVRLPNREDWTDWTFQLGYSYGQIKQRFKGDPNQWSIVCDGERITARTIYRGDFRQWRITNNDQRFTLVSKWGNIADEWLVKEEDFGFFDVYTAREGDPRDWILVDEMDEEVSLGMKMAFAFVVVINCLPVF